MNCRQALAQARKALENCCIEDSSLEAEILLRHVLKTDRSTFFSDLDREITPDEKEKLQNLLERRKVGEPSSYLVGHREFFNLDFKIDRRVLIPRPETELLVEKAIDYCKRYNFLSAADIGTGSGCIAISLVKYLPGISVYAVDASLPALEVAEENSIFHKVKDRIAFLWGNLLEPLPNPVDLIIANLPYVKKHEITSLYEPESALDGGPEGMDKIIELCNQLPGKLKPGSMLLLEIGQGHAKTVRSILHNLFPSSVIEIARDLAGIERIVCLRLTS